MDIDKLISEYNNFLKNYEKGEMFKIRNTMNKIPLKPIPVSFIIIYLFYNIHIQGYVQFQF